jgi:small subunit ribosomal protein S2
MIVKKNKEIEKYIKQCLQQGYLVKKWNPKMAPYILTNKNGFYLFNIDLSSKMLEIVGNLLEKKAKTGATFLFVGTDPISAPLIQTEALLAKSYYINYRWLGGMLTNWKTIQSQIKFLKDLENNITENCLKNLTKKEFLLKEKRVEKLKKLFNGIKNLKKLPDFVIFTNQLSNLLAIEECFQLGIPTICIVDTNSNPDLITYPIPANENSFISIKFILQYLRKKILKGFNQD